MSPQSLIGWRLKSSISTASKGYVLAKWTLCPRIVAKTKTYEVWSKNNVWSPVNSGEKNLLVSAKRPHFRVEMGECFAVSKGKIFLPHFLQKTALQGFEPLASCMLLTSYSNMSLPSAIFPVN